MDWIISLFSEHKLLLLFSVITIGYALVRINFFGIKFGAAAVLFVGLAISALNPDISLPPLVTTIGLVLFVYSIGISSGANFFKSFKRFGIKDSIIVFALLVFAAICIVGLSKTQNIQTTIAAGIFTGALTNTPALASTISLLDKESKTNDSINPTEPTIGYSIAYPLGVFMPILAIFFWQRRFKIDYKKDIKKAHGLVAVGDEIVNQSVRVTNEEYINVPIKDLKSRNNWGVVFCRLKRGKTVHIIDSHNEVIRKNDIVSIIGSKQSVASAVDAIGVPVTEKLEFESADYMYRRVFVSEKKIVGKTIADLKLPETYGAIVTRIRRGDADFLVSPHHVLEYGDRVRYVCPKQYEHTIAKVFGDSYRSIGDIHPMSIGLGITLGLLIGMIPITLPGGITFQLGEAGGPLVAGLILSYLRRTGPVVWTISHNANHTIRELGLSLMLAGIGVRSGQTFVNGIQDGNGLSILLIGGFVSFLIPMLFIPYAFKYLRLPFGVISGMVSAIHTQPAVTSYALQQSKNELPTYGYVRYFPIATIAKIIIAQLIISLALL